MSKSPTLDPAAIQKIQEKKLRQLVRHAYRRVPYYKTLFKEAAVLPRDIQTIADLSRIPISTKTQLRAAPPASLLDTSVDRNSLPFEHSSGSTATPFATHYDRRFRWIRNLMFLRGLRAVGYRFGHKLLLITSPGRSARSNPSLRWRYASIEDSATELWELLRDFSPHFVYGSLSSLRLLAGEIGQEKHTVPRIRAVISTAETLGRVDRDLLSSAFRCEVFDFYGLSEMGLVAFECVGRRGYHISEDVILVESIPLEGSDDTHRLVMTNLESTAMPFIRYDSGDIASPADEGPCRCGSRFALVRGVEGRVVDCIRFPDGRRISPYLLTCRLEKLPAIDRYQVVQEDYNDLTVRVHFKKPGHCCSNEEIEQTVRSVVGAEMSITVERLESSAMFLPSSGSKFRAVESKLPEERCQGAPRRT